MPPTNAPFDPYTQNVTMLMADGVTPINVSMADIDFFNFRNMKVCANYASQLGACIIMFVLVLVVTNPSKRKARLFWINLTSLALAIIRPILLILYYTGPWSEFYAYFAYDYSSVPRSAFANSVAAELMTFLLLCCIELSLFLQVQVITRAMMGDHYRWTLLGLSGIVVALTIGLRFGVLVRNSQGIIDIQYTYDIQWLDSGALIMETISIWYFCFIFVTKLGYCIWERKKKLSLQPWGPMDVICIMGGCTMVIPSIFAIIQYFPDTTFPEAGSLALTTVAIFLPLSSIWAAATPEGSHPLFRSYRSDTSDRNRLASYSVGPTIDGRSCYDSATGTEGKGSAISPTTVATMVEHVRKNSTGHNATSDHDVDEYLDANIRVDRSYSIHSGRGRGPAGGRD